MLVTLQLPKKAQAKVKPGQKVKVGDPFYSSLDEEEASISVVTTLGIKPADIFQYVTVVVGDTIKQGDVVAERKKFVGKKTTTSEVEGTVKHIDHAAGSIVVATYSSRGGTVQTFFTGEIKDVDTKALTVSVNVGKGVEIPAKGDVDCGGELAVFDEKEYFSITMEDVRDRIILTHTLQSHIETKLEALDAAGVIYVKGTPEGEIPCIKLSKKEDFDILAKGTQSHVVYSTHDNKLYAYT